MHVTLNMAASLDGRVAGPGGKPLALSGPADWARVHRLRANCDAVMVGIGTVLADDPRLTARTDPPPARQPLRVVVDSRRRTPADATVVDATAPSLVMTASPGPDRLGEAEVQVCGAGQVDLPQAVDALAARGVQRLLVEGGPTLAAALLTEGLVDQFTLYLAPRVLGRGPSLWSALEDHDLELRRTEAAPLGAGVLLGYEVAR